VLLYSAVLFYLKNCTLKGGDPMIKLAMKELLKELRNIFSDSPTLVDLEEIYKKHEPILIKIAEMPTLTDRNFDRFKNHLLKASNEAKRLAKKKRIPWHLETMDDALMFIKDTENILSMMSSDEERAYNLFGLIALCPTIAASQAVTDYMKEIVDGMKRAFAN